MLTRRAVAPSQQVNGTVAYQHGPRTTPRVWAALPVVFYTLHVIDHLLGSTEIWSIFWICHLANLLLAVGIVRSSSKLVSIALMWLIMGNGLWGVYLLGNGTFYVSSLCSHIGGLLVALFALARLGFSPGVWYQAVALGISAQWLTRWLTPPEHNVNLAHHVWEGWETVFPSYAWYLVFIYSLACVIFYPSERILAWLFKGLFQPQ